MPANKARRRQRRTTIAVYLILCSNVALMRLSSDRPGNVLAYLSWGFIVLSGLAAIWSSVQLVRMRDDEPGSGDSDNTA